MYDDEELNGGQNEDGLQEQSEQFQEAANNVVQSAQNARARAQAIARAPGQAMKMAGQAVETTGRVLEITGKGMQLLGKGMQTLGKGMQKAGKGIYDASKAMYDSGQSLCATGVGAIAGIPMMIAGILGMGIGKATELLGKAVEVIGKVLQKIGKLIEKAGKAIAKMGKRLKELGDKAIQAANAASGAGIGSGLAGGGSSGGDSSSESGTGGIPSLVGGKKGSFKKIIIIAVISIIVFILLFLLIRDSTTDDGKYQEGNLKNVPYVVSSYVMDNLVIVNDSTGNYTYAFKDENGKIISLDEAIENAVEVLDKNKSNSLSNLGEDKEKQIELIKSMILAEVTTQYPDITLNKDLGLDTSTASYDTGSVNDYCVHTGNSASIPACTEEELTKMINSSKMSNKAKNNILPLVPNIIAYQEQYKVNAVFFISVAKQESAWGTAWDLIDESTYNWVSIQGDANGGYVDVNGTSWNKYNSFNEATESWFKLISNNNGSYFGDGKDSVYKIGPIYCDLEWSNAVAKSIEEFYGYIDVTPSTVNTQEGGTSNVSGQKTGDYKITEEIDKDSAIKGGIKIQRKDENGNLVDLKYTSTDNFNALVAANDSESLNYYTLVKSGGNFSSSVSNFSGNTNAEIVWNFLRSKGLSETAAAAIIGNLMQESGEDINPNITEAGSGIGFGIAQWSFGRRDQLNNYAQAMNKDVSSIELQLEFLWTEVDPYADHTYSNLQWGSMSHGWNGESLYNQFIGMTDINEATAFFCWAHERPATSAANLENRQRCARNVYELYAGTTSNNTSSNKSENGEDEGLENSNNKVEIQSLDNFLFIGDSRYEGIETQLQALGNNVTAIGVGSSTPKNWIEPIKNGGGVVYRGETTSNGEDIGSLPSSVSGVSVMLGVNGVSNTTQINYMQNLLNAIHTKYPNAPIFVNSVYHLGSAYGSGTDAMNVSVDNFNNAIKDFCSEKDWLHYIDVNANLDNESGYLKPEYSGDGLHISSTEGISTLVNNIKSKILNSGASTSSNATKGGKPGYSLVVANRKDVNTIVVNNYSYATTWVTNIGQGGHEDPSARISADIPAETLVNETVTTYNASSVDYQSSLQNFTLYFDFLWAILCDSGNTELVSDWAKLAYGKEDSKSKVVITAYNDVSISQSGPSNQSKGYITRSNGNNSGINITDRYNVTESTTITTKTLTSKPCITYADTWLVEYKNDANSYNEYKSKSQEMVTEKTDANSEKTNIIKILKARPNLLKVLVKEQDMVEEMIEENEEISFMVDIYDYILKIASDKDRDEIGFNINSLLDTNLFDLTTKQSVSTSKVLLYDTISISGSDKLALQKAVESICGQYGDSEENYQRKKYVTSVILNRVLSSEFPNSIKGVLSQEYQFENFDPSMLGGNIEISEDTKDAVEHVIKGGDCSNYSVYFARPSIATSNNWDEIYKFTINDGDDSDSSFNYYTTESIISELQRYEVTITGSITKSSETADNIVKWAKNQVNKSEYINSYNGEILKASQTSAQFVKSAYYSAGLEYMSGNAIDLPCPNAIQVRDDGTVNWKDIPVGAIIVSKGTVDDNATHGHVALYIGNGCVIEAGGEHIRKVPIDQSYGAGSFIGWGFAMADQDKAYEKLVIKIGSNYSEGWTYFGCYNEISDGIAGIYKNGNKVYNVYVQGYGGNAPWANMPYSQGTYSSSACGATSVSIIATGYGNDVVPSDLGTVMYASMGYPNGSFTDIVTSYRALSNGLNNYGIEHRWATATQSEIIEHLKQGKPVIMNVSYYSVGNRYFDGHYVTLLGVNENGQIFLGDPAAGGSNSGYFDTSKIFTNGNSYSICFIE